ncbi:Rhodanese-like domain-containing protein [Pseudoxanthomonas wuyuanensis]|uniref:Rhodanese-like domain-containing protein n=1 Tax=Pseudoxanthomonas wuyuanensis TaxID=1073196 RepID=A0A286CYZ7_9GAMM|nr:Rhodanese-like domain-containing protein [Pseudoxanthomonas wuyuanensis]
MLGAAAPVPLAKPVLTSDSAVARTCLVDAATASKDARVIDLRPRDQYAAFHIPGADNQPMTALMNQGSKKAVVYDGGKLPQDAQLLCERLARYGLTQFQVIDGGLASWSQLHAPARAAEVSRLSDADVSSALLANEGQVLALSAEFNPVLKSIQSQARKPGKRLIVLASSPALLPQIQKQLSRKPGGRTALYWIGDAGRLQSLISTHIAQDQKRLEGPGHSNTCSSL